LKFYINNQWEQGTSLVVVFEEEALQAKCKNLKWHGMANIMFYKMFPLPPFPIFPFSKHDVKIPLNELCLNVSVVPCMELHDDAIGFD
jgi:hypothetical protein